MKEWREEHQQIPEYKAMQKKRAKEFYANNKEEQKNKAHIRHMRDNNSCPDCGKLITNHAQYCRDCFKLGERSSFWKGGISKEPYDKNWTLAFKRAIRKRDNYVCMMCGIHSEKLNESLSIHHINYDKKLSIPQNCCATCRSCNSKVNHNRKHYTKFFQDLLAERYEYKYEDGEIILEVNF